MKTNLISQRLVDEVKKDVNPRISAKTIEQVLQKYIDLEQKKHDRVNSPEEVYKRYKHLAYESNELVIIAALNLRMEVTHDEIIYRGLKDSVAIDPVDLLNVPISNHEKNFIMVHNHPSGYSELSDNDIILAGEIQKMATSMKMNFVDSITIAKDGYVSTRAKYGTIWRNSQELEY
ncbi:JAB domain-containing protein [Mollicutes bacterium LVI A0078]|nr:JAB domain-containing protein [Mollicutes bacterium LVI A0075]WOO91304.1 JAB domain-containing protein [Mollicutes bacterium LVI A0078]